MAKSFIIMVNLYIFNESSPAAVYGIGTYIRELTLALKDSDINVCIVHLRTDNQKEEEEETAGIRHLYIPPPINRNTSLDVNSQRELYYRNVVYLLRLQTIETTGLVFHLNYNQSGKLAEDLKKIFDCKIITTVHYFDWCFDLFGNVTRFRKILAAQETDRDDTLKKTVEESYRNEKTFFETVDHILCLSKNTQQILQDDYQINPNKVTVIYNGLIDSNPTSNKQALRQKYDIPDVPIILFAGRLDDIKGLTYALWAFKTVLSTQPHCHFIIAGNGSFDIFMKECKDIWMHVTWTGLIDRNKLFDLYSIADIGVMPSFHEQCSYVAIEMMMHGLPIISSTTTGLKEMIVDGETGLHIPVIEDDDKVEIDTSLLAEKILYMLENTDERRRMGKNARKCYEERYSIDLFRKIMLKFYDSLYE